MSSWRLALASVVLVATFGCGSKSGNTVDSGVGSTCTSDDDCGPGAPVCSASGTCVECETAEHCPADRPVCSNQSCGAACAGSEVQANFVTRPSDIIWIVDQSGSMNQETQYVQAKINEFAQSIAMSNIDYRVTMIAAISGSNAICVPAPLSNGSCGNNTHFRLVDQRISSTDGPQRMLSTYSQYSDFLRLDGMKHIIFVTDDNSAMSATNYTNMLQALQPTGMFESYKVHAIYAYGNGTSSGCSGPFGTGAKDGTVYTTLVTQTMGARGVICEDDWTQVFTDISQAVVSGSQVSCELAIPEPETGETVDPAKVNVRYQMGGVAPGSLLPQVPSAADCTGAGGWYYDDNTAPTTITLCPTTCTSVQGDPEANVKVEFGCSTVIL
jgi:hypothetical protein